MPVCVTAYEVSFLGAGRSLLHGWWQANVPLEGGRPGDYKRGE